jgi:hypothetical protein
MRVDPDLKKDEKKAQSFMEFKKWAAIVISFITAYFFFFKILFF